MKKSKNRLFSISLILLLSLSVFFIAAPQAQAIELQIETHAYVMLSPETVGVSQWALVTYRIDKVAAGATIRAGLFNGTSVTITRPDGTTETKTNLAMDSTSAGYFQFTPTTAGTYYFQTNFPAQWVNSTSAGVTTSRLYLASTSSKVALVVTQDPIPSYPTNPLPEEYWTRPVNAENKGWWQITDNWLMQGYDFTTRPFYWGTVFAPYTPGPETPHVLWNKPIWDGGMVGGRFGDRVYYTGLSYEQYYLPIIINGKILYQEHGPTGTATFGTRCIDLYTGEEIYFLNNTSINYAQTLDIETGNEHGLIPYLWSISGQNWYMYDPFTGRMLLNLTGMPTGGYTKFGDKGEILIYILNANQNTLVMWNVTRAIGGATVFDTWSPAYGSTINASRPLSTNPATEALLRSQSNSPFMGVEWNVTLPDVPGNQAICAINEGWILAEYRDASSFPQIYEDMAYSLDQMKRGATGAYPSTLSHSWIANRTTIYSAYYRAPWNIDSGVYGLFDEGDMQTHGYDIKTGRELWATEKLTSGWGIFTYQVHFAYGRLYTAGFDGYVRCYNSTTGQMIWKFYFGNMGYETPYGTLPTYNGYTIADGKMYITNDEHSPDSVMWRGGKLWCLDAFNGQQLWNISGWMRMPAIADGILTSLNVLDGQVYTLGKGPTETTVTAPQTTVAEGTGVVITGSVTDQSPGKPGIACVADDWVYSWMEYQYMQKPKPTTAEGVQVHLVATNEAGNEIDIGTATTDINGNFGIIWTPTTAGFYQITAKFDGTKAYYRSESTTYMGVTVAPEPTTSTPQPTATVIPTETPVSTPTASPSATVDNPSGISTETLLIAGAAVIIVIAVVAAAILLKKRQ